MLRLLPTLNTCAALVTAAVFLVPTAHAQDAGDCVRAQAADLPARQIFTCGGALTFEREPGAALRIIERSTSPAPRAIDVDGGAILLEVSPGSAPTQIRTPHAVATVRGTIYIVDAGRDQSSIFVLEGSVAVRRTFDAASVTLQPGEGVDVTAQAPLIARPWGAARVATLLARFGR